MELNKSLVVRNVLMITDHFMRYTLAVVTKDQTTKTVMKVFYECFIMVFGAPMKLLSDRGANFMSTLVDELCATFGIQKCQTTVYCYIVGLGPNCKFIDLLFKRLVITFIKISFLNCFIVSEITYSQTDTLTEELMYLR